MDESRNDARLASEALLAWRRGRLERLIGRRLDRPGPSALPPERRRHLLDEARELYWNELSWEQLTAEERVDGSQRVERMFPGFLALVDGLLQPAADGPAGCVARRAGVVEEILRFLAAQCVAPEDEDGVGDAPVAAELTARLLDLVLYRLHALSDDEIERAEIARLKGDE
ncbi:MAG TPA: hypothetical protein VF212_06955 [Longimicrobiales bacterium]